MHLVLHRILLSVRFMRVLHITIVYGTAKNLTLSFLPSLVMQLCQRERVARIGRANG